MDNYGALLYNIVLDYVTFELGSWMGSDSDGTTSNKAQNIYYRWYNDPNVEKIIDPQRSDWGRPLCTKFKYRTKTSRFDLSRIQMGTVYPSELEGFPVDRRQFSIIQW